MTVSPRQSKVSKSKNVSVAAFISNKIAASPKTQTQIATELNYPNPNIITMFKQGRTKVPILKVAEIAHVLDTDPVELLRVVMNEYSPETWNVLESVMGASLVTETERNIIEIVREVAGNAEVMPTSNDDILELKNLVTKWKDASKSK